MSFLASPQLDEFFRIQCRLERVLAHDKPALFRVTIAHARRLGLGKQVAFYEGALAKVLARTPAERMAASDRIAGALMLSQNLVVREHARQQLRGFIGCGAQRVVA
jgi:hypothetical protein